MSVKKYDLENRFVEYACNIVEIIDALPNTKTGYYFAGQLIRSSNSPALNYGEAQAAESKKDFIHKLGLVLKELKECRTALKIVLRMQMIKQVVKIKNISIETEELIAIIAKSISTAKNNMNR